MRANGKDLASGAFFTAAGLLYGGMAIVSLPIGSALNMGPGYFPIVLAGITAGLGLIIMARSFFTRQKTPYGVVPWRGAIFISAATIFFALLLEDLGLLPTIFGSVALVSLAVPNCRIKEVLGASIVISALCALIFGYFLKLPVPIVGPVFHILSF
jgi:hypothetical protein